MFIKTKIKCSHSMISLITSNYKSIDDMSTYHNDRTIKIYQLTIKCQKDIEIVTKRALEKL